MSFHDPTIRLRALALVVAAAAATSLILPGSGGATVSSPRPRTLVATNHWIWTVAQDGGRIAWVSRLATHHCGLYLRTLRTGRTETTRLSKYDCDQFAPASDLALAGRSAAWVEDYTGGNNERSWFVASATAGDQRVRRVDAEDVGCDTDSCGGEPDPMPYLAGAGRLIVYANGQGNPSVRGRTVVERIRGRRVGRLFDAPGQVYGMSLGNGLIATASLLLEQGDGCGCLDFPVWSPDGTKIAYLHGRFDRYGGGYGSVAVMNGDGSGRHDITTGNSSASSLSWSPDGTKIAYEGTPAGQLWVVNADGSALYKLATGYEPAWSPDGTKIAYAGTGGIFVTNPDGTNTKQLLSASTNVGGLAWSPDGTRIAFSLAGVLELMNADGSNVHLLGSAITGDEPAWSPDGSQVVFRDADGLAVIGADGADGSGQRQLTTGPDEHPSWSPDGKTIIFASARNDPYANGGIYTDGVSLELYLVAPDGGNLHPLSFSQPAAWLNTVTIHSTGGKLVGTLPGARALQGRLTGSTSVALAGDIAAVAEVPAAGADQITLFDARSGAQFAVVDVGANNPDFGLVGGNAHWAVFRIGRTISALNVSTHEVIRVARLAVNAVDVSVSGRRVLWAENSGKAPRRHGRIRAVDLPS